MPITQARLSAIIAIARAYQAAGGEAVEAGRNLLEELKFGAEPQQFAAQMTGVLNSLRNAMLAGDTLLAQEELHYAATRFRNESEAKRQARKRREAGAPERRKPMANAGAMPNETDFAPSPEALALAAEIESELAQERRRAEQEQEELSAKVKKEGFL